MCNMQRQRDGTTTGVCTICIQLGWSAVHALGLLMAPVLRVGSLYPDRGLVGGEAIRM